MGTISMTGPSTTSTSPSPPTQPQPKFTVYCRKLQCFFLTSSARSIDIRVHRAGSQLKTAEPRDGLLPTQPLSDAETETICILSGLKNVREAGNIANELQEFVVEDFSKKYNGKLHKGQKISVQIFSPRK